ncbi:MAG TPA: hypothetical protein VEF55_11470 [Candidatus Binatia bacterium]|nr:hypothetical protein [Candidatus Binatia bacterium]
MSSPALLVGLALAIALVVAGAVASFASGNALKKVTAVLIALAGAAFAAAMVGAPSNLLIGAAAIAFAYCGVGVAVVVRLQEAYGTTETHEIDAADEQDEPREPET